MKAVADRLAWYDADGMFTISNISYYADAKLATDMSSEADWKRQGLYMGPAVSNPFAGFTTVCCVLATSLMQMI